MGAVPSIGVYNYRPEKKEEDLGVDGFGLGIDGKSLTVQVKFRSDPNTELDQHQIKQFPYQSVVRYGVDPHVNTNLVLITSCKGLYPMTRSRTFCGKIREINIEQIKNLIDDNEAFWKNFNFLIDNTIETTYRRSKLKEVKGMRSDVEDENREEASAPTGN